MNGLITPFIFYRKLKSFKVLSFLSCFAVVLLVAIVLLAMVFTPSNNEYNSNIKLYLVA